MYVWVTLPDSQGEGVSGSGYNLLSCYTPNYIQCIPAFPACAKSCLAEQSAQQARPHPLISDDSGFVCWAPKLSVENKGDIALERESLVKMPLCPVDTMFSQSFYTFIEQRQIKLGCGCRWVMDMIEERKIPLVSCDVVLNHNSGRSESNFQREEKDFAWSGVKKQNMNYLNLNHYSITYIIWYQ